jgi:GTP cyclohydrolase II
MHVPNRVIRPQSQVVASATLPTQHGSFRTHVFRGPAAPSGRDANTADVDDAALAREHVALVRGDVRGAEGLAVRVHSECLTSEVFGSLKCDCKEQLDAAMADIARRGAGAILYLRQEGRGIGLANKIRAYALQHDGHDTVDANRLLGLPDDAREYGVARDMLEWLGVKSVRLMTNNPEKISALRELGVDVVGRIPVVVAPNAHSAGYLEAKRLRMSHALPGLPDAASSARSSRSTMRAASGDAE